MRHFLLNPQPFHWTLARKVFKWILHLKSNMLNVSMLPSYLYCARKLFFQSILEVEEPPKEVLVLGSIRHETYDIINKKEEELVTSITEKTNLNVLYQKYKQTHSRILREIIIKNKHRLKEVNLQLPLVFKQTWPLILEESTTRANNIFNFMETHLVYGNKLWEKLTPKIESEYRMESENLQLKGIIDQLEIYENGFVPVELKTGKCPKDGVWPGHRIQIGAYALLLEDKFNAPIKEGFITYLDQKERRHITINPFLKEEILQIRDKVNHLLTAKEMPDFCGNENKCNKCSIKDLCFNEKEVKKRLKNI